MRYMILARDGRVLMQTFHLACVDPEQVKSQKAAGCRFKVEDATPAELEELARRGVRIPTRKETKC